MPSPSSRSSLSYLKNSIATMHPSPSARRYPCPVTGCLRVCRTASEYREHILNLHADMNTSEFPTLQLLVSDDDNDPNDHTDNEDVHEIGHLGLLDRQRASAFNSLAPLARVYVSMPRLA